MNSHKSETCYKYDDIKAFRNHSFFIKVFGFSSLVKIFIRGLHLLWVSVSIKDVKKLKCMRKNVLKYWKGEI